MYRAASLFGIGNILERTPYFHNNSKCIRKMKKELESTFTNIFTFVKLKVKIYPFCLAC